MGTFGPGRHDIEIQVQTPGGILGRGGYGCKIVLACLCTLELRTSDDTNSKNPDDVKIGEKIGFAVVTMKDRTDAETQQFDGDMDQCATFLTS